ncbi:hypothetical protein [Salmonirosea aquatica]|uniref:Gingipain domain-containing protein n=1 Tax=Salmonirosea aquatica TaxID=2654236 RepID=A0A7C9FYY9_9BACT|nr:hypothetical protein [Cytophagaceae bacterium SJW1-29]
MRAIVNLQGDISNNSIELFSTITTAPAPIGRKKKLLFVVDQEWRDNAAISQALQTYSRDVNLTDTSVVFGYYYIGTSLAEKIALYENVKRDYLDNDLAYLFFIGRNAVVPIATVIYDTNNQIVNRYSLQSFTYYTFPRYNAYQFDANSGEFVSPRTPSLYDRSETEKLNAVFQQTGGAISMGMLVPDISYDRQTSTNRILAYFDKLHRYKNYEFGFDKKVLITDGFTSDVETMNLAEQNDRWYAADSVKFGRVKNNSFSGYDQLWKDDYIQKLRDNSYEILTYNGHGSSSYHSFGITETDITPLPALNTQIINFHSCDVGNFRHAGYLANKYLETGNVLAAHAYSDLLFAFTINGRSALAPEFDRNGVFDNMSKGETISDAFRHYTGYIDTELILGDPLLTLRESCGPVIESQTSGDWHTRSTWTCGRIPTQNDTVRILPGHVVTLQNIGQVKDIAVEGKLDLLESGRLEY